MNMRFLPGPLALFMAAWIALAPSERAAKAAKNEAAAPAPPYFAIQVVDEQTGRGVPLVQLRTTNEISYYTDSAGLAAFFEPGLMGKDVFFHVKSHGYEYPKDGFDYRGKKLRVTEGGSATLRIKRLNVAERLYRATGEGIYRDSVLLGRPVPIKEPLINGLVMGQDSAVVSPYRGKLYWFWGDTNRPAYPLGNFGTSGATSELPSAGGLDPSVGIDLDYFVDKDGFSRPMVPESSIPGPGPKWISGLATIKDKAGAERLIAGFVRIKTLGEAYERGLIIFNDEKNVFERLARFDLKDPLYLDGHSCRVRANGKEYLCGSFKAPYSVRVLADMDHVTSPAAYEGFSCLAPGARYEKAATKLERDGDGRLVYGWKANTESLSFDQQKELVKAGKMKPEEGWLQLRDVETGAPIEPHAGSVRWSPYRNRWVMIVQQVHGTSFLGETWFAEADTFVGPWVYARKILTHDTYTFYNPVHHEFFDQDGGRLIYFEGTYAETFSGAKTTTPRYNYNQIMYRLALDDPRLALPAPVYRMKDANGGARYIMRESVEAANCWDQIESIPFFAVPPARKRDGLIPIYANEDKGGAILQHERPSGAGAPPQPLFLAVAAQDEASTPCVPLYELTVGEGKSVPSRSYAIESEMKDELAQRAKEPLCRIWPNPMSSLLLDYTMKPN